MTHPKSHRVFWMLALVIVSLASPAYRSGAHDRPVVRHQSVAIEHR